MARIPGIQIERDSKGRETYAHIDLKKRPEFFLFLLRVGAITKDEFDMDWVKDITDKDIIAQLHHEIEK